MHISLAAERIFSLFGLPITNSMLMTWLAMLILVIVAYLAGRRPQLVPGKLQNLLESILEFFFNLVNSILQDKTLSYQVFPIVATFFLLIVLSNWLGLLPGVGPIGYFHEVHGEVVLTPLFRPTNADINSTLSWAIISVVVTQFFGVMMLGLGQHVSKYVNLNGLLSFKFEGLIHFFVGILELFSEISKMISFSFRLFGNIFAGEVLLTVMAFLVPFIAPLPFYFLELFVGLVQGVVFATLTLVFIKVAVTSHEHTHNEELRAERHELEGSHSVSTI